jgi:hypothetical protein
MLVKAVYLNSKQKQFVAARQKRKTFKAGRGTGKTHVMGAHEYWLYRNLPTGKSLIASITFEQLLTKTMPEIEASWRSWNCFEWDPKQRTGHWVFGKKPPSHWVKPYKMPKNPERCYFFLNGHVKELASLEVNNRFRGGSYDSLSGDESALFKKEVWDKIFCISVRGRTRGPHAWKTENHMAGMICDFTSAPWRPEGQWINDTRELAKQHPDKYFWLEASTLDNIEYLGAEYIQRLKETLSPEEYMVEVLNQDLTRPSGGGYYPAFREDIHTTIDTWEYAYGDNGRMTVRRDAFIQGNLPFMVSIDFNVAFTSMIVAQELQSGAKYQIRICDNLFVKPDPTKDPDGLLLIDTLIDNFCNKYRYHHIKTVEVYGDATANNKRVGARPMFDQVVDRFRKHGWLAINRSSGRLPLHENRFFLINNLLGKKETRFPDLIINANTCKALILSIINAPIKPDFSKDKRSESRQMPQELATHLSDVFDYLIMSKYGSLVLSSSDNIWTSLIPSRKDR